MHILGHDAVAKRFSRAVSRSRLAGSFLFVGPSGIGKRSFAFSFAKSLLCQHPVPNDAGSLAEACGSCTSCGMFPDHPDFFVVSKPADKTFIPLELLVGSKEHRGREGLCYEISRTPYLGGRKIAVIDDADYFNPEGANALLKTLEEPPSDSLIFLIGTSAAKQLPTIRSRCQIIRFQPLSRRNIASILLEQEMVESLEQGLKVATHANGSLDGARDFLDEALESFREELNHQLLGRRIDSVKIAERFNEFVDAAGKEPQLRRKRLRILFTMVLEHDEAKLRRGENHATGRQEIDVLTSRIERTLDALEQIDHNANVPYIIDSWAYELRNSTPHPLKV